MDHGYAVRHSVPSARTVILAMAGAIALSSLLHAQAPQTTAAPAAREETTLNRLPVRRVVLYKSGVGYFEHLGRIRDNQTVTIDFTSAQLDDVLKSLTTMDLGGGRVLGINYNSEAELERRLGALRLPVGQQATRLQMLTALRGARVEVRSSTVTATGRLLSVEQTQRRADGVVVSVEVLSLITATGDMQTVALEPGVHVRILEADLNQEIGRYLSLVGSVRDRDVRRVAIATNGTGDRDLFVSYISEVPVWKPTYRLVIPSASQNRKPLLQGWAVIDNTVGEDWENVELSLVAGAPQSFVQKISRPVYVQRPVVEAQERMTMRPQTHQGGLAAGGTGAITGTITDRDGGAIPGATVRITRDANVSMTVVTNPQGTYQARNLSPGTYQVTFTLQGFKTQNHPNVTVSGGMETIVNGRLEIGALSETVMVRGAPSSSINVTLDGVATLTRDSTVLESSDKFFTSLRASNDSVEEIALQAAAQSDAGAAQLGDLFEYKLKQPVTIRKNQSALVPILSGEVEAEKVSLWNASSGMSRPLRAVWLTNSTDLTLDGGTFSVIEGQAFAGEGLMEPLKAAAKRLLSYAVDLGLTVDAKGEAVPTMTTRLQVARGLVTQTAEERQRRTYSVRNDDTEPRTLIIEHPSRDGWKVTSTVEAVETTAAWHRFRIVVQPRTTAMLVVNESHVVRAQYAVGDLTDDHVALFVREELVTPAVEASLRQILAQKAVVSRLESDIASRENEIETIEGTQNRVRENMKALKGSAEERQLLQRYVKQLRDQEDRIETLRAAVESLNADHTRAEEELTRMIEALIV